MHAHYCGVLTAPGQAGVLTVLRVLVQAVGVLIVPRVAGVPRVLVQVGVLIVTVLKVLVGVLKVLVQAGVLTVPVQAGVLTVPVQADVGAAGEFCCYVLIHLTGH